MFYLFKPISSRTAKAQPPAMAERRLYRQILSKQRKCAVFLTDQASKLSRKQIEILCSAMLLAALAGCGWLLFSGLYGSAGSVPGLGQESITVPLSGDFSADFEQYLDSLEKVIAKDSIQEKTNTR